jgi:dihydroorotate dehydrogenase
MFYEKVLKPILFRLDPEDAHNLIANSLEFAQLCLPASALWRTQFSIEDPVLASELLGIKFPNPVGLAAGFDKNCRLIGVLPNLGFGFIECGTVTALGQIGNPRPRLYRLPEYEGLINRLGFNNRGSEWVESHLSKQSLPAIPLGINIGKSKIVELENAPSDYLISFERLFRFASYITVNVSSPNTPRLRELQENLDPLLGALQKKNAQLARAQNIPVKPILVKIAPDTSLRTLDEIIVCCLANNINGIIATNTTVSREGITMKNPQDGGLSGAPLKNRANEILRYLYESAGGKLVLVGAGGISSAEDAFQRIMSGANLVQLYTGLVYKGPSLIRNINAGLVKLLKQYEFSNVQEAVGANQTLNVRKTR